MPIRPEERGSDPTRPEDTGLDSTGLSSSRSLSVLRGISQLAGEAVSGTTRLVESVQKTIIQRLPVLGRTSSGPIRTIAGWVFHSIRGISHGVQTSLQNTLKPLEVATEDDDRPHPRREAAVSALNGVLGDHLVATNNPLAIPMSVRRTGRVFRPNADAELGSHPSRSRPDRVVVFIHGLCLNDRHWNQKDHNYGRALARDLGYTPVYLRYNSGRSIPTNGRLFAKELELLIREWPVPIRALSMVGHSMGGLLARSAWHHGRRSNHAWCEQLTALICLATPHLGAPYERLGQQVDRLLQATPYIAPFSRIGTLRSAGIKDLRHGRIWDRDEPSDLGSPSPNSRTAQDLGNRSYLLAGTTGTGWLPGDGLVPVSSALGQKPDGTPVLPVPDSRKVVCTGLNHFDLLSSPDVYQHVARWLRPDGRSTR